MEKNTNEKVEKFAEHSDKRIFNKAVGEVLAPYVQEALREQTTTLFARVQEQGQGLANLGTNIELMQASVDANTRRIEGAQQTFEQVRATDKQAFEQVLDSLRNEHRTNYQELDRKISILLGKKNVGQSSGSGEALRE